MYQGYSPTQGGRRERAVTEVLGAILVFGLVLAVVALVQVSGIPAANERVEFEHSQFVQQDFQEFGGAIDRAATTGSGESVAVKAGVAYPNRLLFISPGPVAGSVSAGPAASDVVLKNTRAINSETDDYWTGTDDRSYGTSLVEYQIGYNYYDEPPVTTIEHGLIYDEFETETGTDRIIRNNGNVIQGRQITLITMEGEFSTSSSETLTLNTVPLSAPMQRISVEGPDDSTSITIEMPTKLSQGDWETILDGETGTDGYVASVAVDDANDIVTITMKPGVTYDLRMARVGIGDAFESEKPYYITAIRGSDATIASGGSQEFVVEVRDRYNNPVSGVDVTFSDGTSDDGEFQNEPTDPSVEEVVVSSDENGRASALFIPSVTDKSISIEALAGDLADTNSNPNDDHEMVDFQNVRVSGDDSPGGTDINPNVNPNQGGSLVLVDVNAIEDTNNKVIGFEVTFQNTGSVDRSIEELRYSFGFASKSGSTIAPDPVSVSDGGISPPVTLSLGGQYKAVNGELVGPGETTTIRIESTDSAKSFDSFAVFSAIIDAEGDTETALYFIDDAITNNVPTATFDYTPKNPSVGETVSFNAGGSSDPDDDALSYAWDFDSDGTTDATGETVDHVFQTSGNSDVTLTVTDARGATDTLIERINVKN